LNFVVKKYIAFGWGPEAYYRTTQVLLFPFVLVLLFRSSNGRS